MAYPQPKADRGTVYKADEKRTPTSPDYWGFLTVDGRDYKLSGWKQTDKKGKPCLSISLKPKLEERRDSYDRAQAPVPRDNYPDRDEF